jgi:DNA polymerase-3 subunit alpha
LYDNDENIQKAVKFGEELEWNIRQLWVHACGIIIAPKPVYTFSPMQYLKEDDHDIVSQYDWPTMEKIWLLKMDFLWLRNLSIIKNCIKILKKRYEKEWKELPKMFEKFFVDMSFQPDLNDKYTYDKVFKEWDTSW